MLLGQIKTVEAERDALIAAEKQTTSPPTPAAMLLDIRGIGAEFAAILWSEDCSGASITGDRLQHTQVWLLRPGKADLSIGNKGSRKPGTQGYGQRLFSWLGYGCVISRSRRSPCGSRNASSRGPLAEDDIVALARKLLIALWKYVTLGVVIEGAVMKAA